MSRCKGCNAPIKWVKTKKGKTIPVNPWPLFVVPNPKGADTVVRENGQTVTGDSVEVGTPGAVVGYIAHFATCPGADKFRQQPKPKAKK